MQSKRMVFRPSVFTVLSFILNGILILMLLLPNNKKAVTEAYLAVVETHAAYSELAASFTELYDVYKKLISDLNEMRSMTIHGTDGRGVIIEKWNWYQGYLTRIVEENNVSFINRKKDN